MLSFPLMWKYKGGILNTGLVKRRKLNHKDHASPDKPGFSIGGFAYPDKSGSSTRRTRRKHKGK